MKITITSALVPIDDKAGTSYPAVRGDVLDLPQPLAKRLVKAKHATTGEVDLATGLDDLTPANPDGKKNEDKDPDTKNSTDTNPTDDAESADEGEVSDPHATPESDDSEGEVPLDEDAPDMPRRADPVDAWRAFAVSQGMDEEKAAEATRKDLIAEYG